METYLEINKTIARHIILAQIASDAGKGKHRLFIKGDVSCHEEGYKKKDDHIKQAILLINKYNTYFRYYIVKAPDQKGHISKIIYFTYKNNGMRLQVSFHSFDGGFIKESIGKGMIQHWDKGSSVGSCKLLIKELDLNNN